MQDTWIDQIENLRAMPEDSRRELEAGSLVVSMPAGTHIFAPGQPVNNWLLLLEGTVRVQQSSDTGREVFLYRVQAGECLVLTTAFRLSSDDHSIDGFADTDVRAVAIPHRLLDDMLAQSPVFRSFVFAAFTRRITSLFKVIDTIVFQRVDVRLAGRLLELSDKDHVVRATHAVLATELGTAREVISRTMSEFHRRGWVQQARGEVCLTGREGLERLARSADGHA